MGGAGDSIQTRILTMGETLETQSKITQVTLTVRPQAGNQVEAEMAAEPLLLFSS